jgi:hypothetical protein
VAGLGWLGWIVAGHLPGDDDGGGEDAGGADGHGQVEAGGEGCARGLGGGVRASDGECLGEALACGRGQREVGRGDG